MAWLTKCVEDSHVLPPEIEDIFRRVQDSAHYMPDWQMEVCLHLSISRLYALLMIVKSK